MSDNRIEDSRYAKTGREMWLSRRVPVSRWRKRARAAMRAVVERNPDADSAALLKLVDAAYPFGPRSHAPYKAWLGERRLLADDIDPVAPTKNEADVLSVAHDMAEQDRRIDGVLEMSAERRAEIVAHLDEHAPHRHARPCLACGAKRGAPCREADVSTFTLQRPDAGPLAHAQQVTTFTERLIPHAVRYLP